MSARNPELIFWGAFLTAVGTGAMVWVQVPPGIVATVSGLLLFAFGITWYFSSTQDRSPAARPGAALPATAPRPEAVQPSPAASGPTAADGAAAAAPAAAATLPAVATAPNDAQVSSASTTAIPVPNTPVPDLSTRVPGTRRHARMGAVAVPPPSPGPVRMGSGMPAAGGRRAAAAPVFHEMPAEPSRWTRTFGPPETGQIPLQPYLSGTPASFATADADLPDRRQRSHSSL
ncbi:hypothetical protein [Arthrobacter sp. YD2]|uniref:hypothetical protein n=1 Tax=Arthrobacter sp. YD2 TaxID=3058046 RepID=UPI0025B3C6AE|nr:hypothetical protein [Arthrobacter sp. YD2]MDN3904287.1 hypothetical protein [Arthrobacter sp. YD2]